MRTEMTPQGSGQFRWLATALLGLLVVQITGCVAPSPSFAPEGSAAMKQPALSFAPSPGNAGIYVIRPYQFYNDSYYGRTAAFPINLDYQGFGLVGVNSYLFGLVPPGKHILTSSNPVLFASDFKHADFTAEAGKNYYFTATGAGISGARHLEIDPISETDGQAFVRQFKLSGDNRFELQNPPGQTQ